MSRRLLIDIFSPLPPLPTDIGAHTAGVLAELQELAQLRVWTSQEGSIAAGLDGFDIRRFSAHAIPVAALNQADATFYNLGNNADFHQAIHRVARRVPGIVVLHDTRLQHFFARYSEHPGQDRETYLDLLARSHGMAAREMGQDFIAGTRPFQDLVDTAPMTLAALEGAVAGVVHNAAEQAHLATQTHLPVYYMPLSYRFGAAPKRMPRADARAPTRLVVFGYIGENRRLLPLIRTLGGMPDRQNYRLDIYGIVEQDSELDAAIAEAGLGTHVTRHGFVTDTVLDAALAGADLALNLRWPSMGEASGSQLRIWSAQLPSLVTRTGWYAQLPEDTVFFVDPEREREDLLSHLRAIRRNPAIYARAGTRGRQVLERSHSPRAYAEGLVAIAGQHAVQHARVTAHALAVQAAKLMLELGTPALARPLGAEIAAHIAALSAGRT
jgi:glycosyltransferase involved in cell wall biosynthesis